MGNHYFVRVQTIVAEEQPAAKLLFEWMEPISDHGLRYLGDQRLRVAEQELLERPPDREFGHHILHFHSESEAASG